MLAKNLRSHFVASCLDDIEWGAYLITTDDIEWAAYLPITTATCLGLFPENDKRPLLTYELYLERTMRVGHGWGTDIPRTTQTYLLTTGACLTYETYLRTIRPPT